MKRLLQIICVQIEVLVFHILLVNNNKIVAILQNKPNNTKAGSEEHRHVYSLLNMIMMGELYVIDNDLINPCILPQRCI